MTPEEIREDIQILTAELQEFERKYHMPSEKFYASYREGQEPEDKAKAMDWAAWAGTYEFYLTRVEQANALS